MKKLQDTEYMYSTTRVRVLENRIPGAERMNLLCDAKSVGDVMNRLGDCGITLPEDDAHNLSPEALSRRREEMLMRLLRAAFRDVEEAVPDPAVFSWMRYPYDCNNIKMALKCAQRSISPEETAGMMFDFGTVPVETVIEAVRAGTYDTFPAAFAEGTAKASEAFLETGDPRRIDAVLDRACFLSMSEAAADTGEPALIKWMQAKADLVNAVITLRILRMRRGEMGRMFLEDSLLPGGTLKPAFFLDLYGDGEDALWASLGANGMPDYMQSFARRAGKTDSSLAAVEKALDDAWLEVVRKDAKTPFGAAVPAGYICGWETAVKNIRIVLAAKEAGLSGATVRERVRDSYV